MVDDNRARTVAQRQGVALDFGVEMEVRVAAVIFDASWLQCLLPETQGVSRFSMRETTVPLTASAAPSSSRGLGRREARAASSIGNDSRARMRPRSPTHTSSLPWPGWMRVQMRGGGVLMRDVDLPPLLIVGVVS